MEMILARIALGARLASYPPALAELRAITTEAFDEGISAINAWI
jgi:hypothetical protein